MSTEDLNASAPTNENVVSFTVLERNQPMLSPIQLPIVENDSNGIQGQQGTLVNQF